MEDRIVWHPDICNGRPTILGTRIAVQSVLPAPAAGTITVDNVTGVASVSNNVPAGMYGVTIRATDGAYADSVVMPLFPAAPYNGPVPLAYERRGTYTVSVSANGYATWTRSGVLVTGDQCHVATVPLTARLAR